MLLEGTDDAIPVYRKFQMFKNEALSRRLWTNKHHEVAKRHLHTLELCEVLDRKNGLMSMHILYSRLKR